jgi:hypothetical protein
MEGVEMKTLSHPSTLLPVEQSALRNRRLAWIVLTVGLMITAAATLCNREARYGRSQ